jgi:hypothetical protein
MGLLGFFLIDLSGRGISGRIVPLPVDKDDRIFSPGNLGSHAPSMFLA